MTLKDKDNTQIFSLSTDANGQITQQNVQYGYYDQAHGDTLQAYSPHTLTVSKAGYETRTYKLTVDEKVDWRITLE